MADDDIPRPWSRSDRAVPRALVRPMQEYLRSSISGASLMVGAAAVALVWANLGSTYGSFWATSAAVRLGGLTVGGDLRFWVNEGLMTGFFLLAGLEIRRELAAGELRDPRAAALPVFGAIGGMVLPALLFVAATRGTAAVDGWGMAMPTDVALALGVLVLAARAAPSPVRPFLVTLAIVDDIGTVVVVGLAYSGEVSWGALAVMGAALAAIPLLERASVRHFAAYLLLGVIAWLGAYEAGLHPALVGAVVGFLTPPVPFHRPAFVSDEAHRVADATVDKPEPVDADAPAWLELARLSREAVSPLARTEHALLPWVNLLALPLFALANAGVRLTGDALTAGVERRLIVALVFARLVGKGFGVAGVCFLLVRLGVGRMPAGMGPRALLGAALAAGAPFTVSLFVADAAFPEGSDLLDAARLAIVVAAVVCGAVAIVLLRSASNRSASP